MNAALLVALFVQAHYVDAGGATHTLQLWRDGQKLRRETDGKLGLFVEHRIDGDDRYRVIDRARGRAFSVSRVNLHRIGSFPDWNNLASLATPPKGRSGAREHTAAGECRWVGDQKQQVCWSARLGLALRVREQRDGGWREVLTVDRVARGGFDRSELTPPEDLPLVDVDRDVSGD
jgi:hypothetical protein